MCFYLEEVQTSATKDDIKQEFAISVSGANLRENRERYVDSQKPVFIVHRRDSLLSPVIAKNVELKGDSAMVHNPTTPLPSTKAVAWVETDGPVVCHLEDGTTVELTKMKKHPIETKLAKELEKKQKTSSRIASALGC